MIPFGFMKRGGFDPATLSLTGWWRASYTASPWVGTASAGSSGSNDLTEGVIPPTSGTPVNGLNPGDFASQKLGGAAISTFMTAAAWSGWVLAYVDVFGTNNSTVYANEALVADVGQYWGVFLKSGGGSATFNLYNYDGRILSVSTAAAATTWVLVQFKLEGGSIKLRTNSGSWTTAESGNTNTLTNALVVGREGGGSSYFDGKILEVGLADSALSDANFTSIVSYVNARYGLSL